MRAFVFGLMIAIAGCAPAANEPSAASHAPAKADVAPPAPAPAPLPAQQAPETAPADVAAPQAALPAPAAAQRPPADLLQQGGVDYACNTPADCAVKNVGSCCGKHPACVNKDSPTFPEQVKAQCAKEGMSSICGFQDIASCDCIEGRCTGVAGAGATGELQKD